MEGMASSMPLAAPYKAFERHQALLYRGAVTMLTGGPGSGKTISSLNINNRLRVPSLYISNDSTKYTIINRVFSMLTQQDMAVSKEIVESKPELARKFLAQWAKIRFDFNSKPDIEEILHHGEAFRELFGEYPHLTTVDILMNIDHDGVAEQNYWRLMPELKEIAGMWNTALLAVHHTSESAKGDPCPPMSSIMGKANQLPELIITQAIQGNRVHYAIVKNRNGPSDPSGRTTFTLPIFPSQFRIEDDDEDDLEDGQVREIVQPSDEDEKWWNNG
jgi:hypothetical protein